MRILYISPLGFPVNSETKYAGIEQLVFNFAKVFNKTDDVTVMGHGGSVFPKGIELLPTIPDGDIYTEAEVSQYASYQSVLRDFDVIHDFSHQHLVARYNSNLPTLNIFWHAPAVAQYPKAPYNIIGLSKWACREFKRVYRQEARYAQSICLDTDTYKLSNKHRNERLLCLGRITPNKGVKESVMLCLEREVPLDVAGKGDNDQYDQQVKMLCDGKVVKYHGEVDTEAKIIFYQTCKALLYLPNEPEVTNHKLQEAMLCGAPVITLPIGALPEIVTPEYGELIRIAEDLDEAVKKVEPIKDTSELIDTYTLTSVAKRHKVLYNRVAGGERW